LQLLLGAVALDLLLEEISRAPIIIDPSSGRRVITA
jgi:hypothetical protein